MKLQGIYMKAMLAQNVTLMGKGGVRIYINDRPYFWNQGEEYPGDFDEYARDR